MSGGPVQEKAEIFSVQKVGEYFQFTVVAPGVAAGFQPGHFVAVAVGGENTAMVLRRAFALSAATPSDAYAGTVQFVVAEHGPGTRWLVQRRPGDVLDLVGPLGTPFPLPSGRLAGGAGRRRLRRRAADPAGAGAARERLDRSSSCSARPPPAACSAS